MNKNVKRRSKNFLKSSSFSSSNPIRLNLDELNDDNEKKLRVSENPRQDDDDESLHAVSLSARLPLPSRIPPPIKHSKSTFELQAEYFYFIFCFNKI